MHFNCLPQQKKWVLGLFCLPVSWTLMQMFIVYCQVVLALVHSFDSCRNHVLYAFFCMCVMRYIVLWCRCFTLFIHVSQVHKYVVQAEVLYKTWNLSESQLAFACSVKDLENNETRGTYSRHLLLPHQFPRGQPGKKPCLHLFPGKHTHMIGLFTIVPWIFSQIGL